MSQTRLLAIGLIALVATVTALVALRDGSEVTAQPPDVFDRLDDVQDDLARLRSDVEGVRSEVALARGELGAIRGDIAVVSDRLGRLTRAFRPPSSEPAAYTQALVEEAIARYARDGLDTTVAHYNTPESVNGQWYVVIIDEAGTILAVATHPDTVGQPNSDVFGPDGYPVGAVVDGLVTRDGAWVNYLFANPENGATELKHAWVVRHDGLIFLSGWYEPGPRPRASPAPTPEPSSRAPFSSTTRSVAMRRSPTTTPPTAQSPIGTRSSTKPTARASLTPTAARAGSGPTSATSAST